MDTCDSPHLHHNPMPSSSRSSFGKVNTAYHFSTSTTPGHLHNDSSESDTSTPTATAPSTPEQHPLQVPPSPLSPPPPPPSTKMPQQQQEQQGQGQKQQQQLPQDIPIQYIVDQLHRLGPFYWHKPETTDCTIQVPIDQRRLSRAPNFDYPGSGAGAGMGPTNNLDIRRGSAPVSSQTNPTPKTFTTLKLHQFYLTTQSSLLRALFSGSSVIGLVSAQTSTVPPSSTSAPMMNGLGLGSGGSHYPHALNLNVQGIGRRDSTPSLARIPRLLPSSAHHPTLYLPLPDPTSFPHIVHYLYFGTVAVLEDALNVGRIRWDGVVRNVEYLGIYEEEEQRGQGQGQQQMMGGETIGIRKWLMAWRERQRRRSSAGAGGVVNPQQQQQQQQQRQYAVPRVSSSASGSTFMDPILVEESSEGTPSSSGSSATTDSEDDDMDDDDDDDDMDYDDDDEDDEEEEEEEEETGTDGGPWSSGGESEWDPMVLAIAGMKMADPFALDLAGYANQRAMAAAAAAANGDGNAPMREESVDPLQG